jgi:hypothetical protein
MCGRLPITSSKDWFDMREWGEGHLHYFSIPSLKALLVLSGFEIKCVMGVGHWHQVKTFLPSLFAREISIVAARKS